MRNGAEELEREEEKRKEDYLARKKTPMKFRSHVNIDEDESKVLINQEEKGTHLKQTSQVKTTDLMTTRTLY